ncbi:hypothetical protein GUJ93_ZPchr0011g27512 [Zizania palustris]|uniref:Uncharacterized protein n=1 Tax=Zizania palustris TaxID=103762 RepID=A0A8J5WLV7_ZIZPA|nr:hypothetical protein GUJ93_ZPchr0011g27512 [Zizania palustris]
MFVRAEGKSRGTDSVERGEGCLNGGEVSGLLRGAHGTWSSWTERCAWERELPSAPADDLVQAVAPRADGQSRQLRRVEAALQAVAEWVRGWLEKLGFRVCCVRVMGRGSENAYWAKAGIGQRGADALRAVRMDDHCPL